MSIAIAARSSPFSPITTSRPCGLAGRPGPVELLAETRPDALDQKAHRFAGDGQKAFHAQHAVAIRDTRELSAKPCGSWSAGTSSTKLSKSS